jgi:hypothetical protein
MKKKPVMIVIAIGGLLSVVCAVINIIWGVPVKFDWAFNFIRTISFVAIIMGLFWLRRVPQNLK